MYVCLECVNVCRMMWCCMYCTCGGTSDETGDHGRKRSSRLEKRLIHFKRIETQTTIGKSPEDRDNVRKEEEKRAISTARTILLPSSAEYERTTRVWALGDPAGSCRSTPKARRPLDRQKALHYRHTRGYLPMYMYLYALHACRYICKWHSACTRRLERH